MKKREWIEEHEEDLKRYGKSILSHDDDEHDSMKDYYEFSIMNHDDESQYGGDDWYEPMGHFKD